MFSRYQINLLQDAIDDGRAAFFVERCLIFHSIDHDTFLDIIGNISKIENQGVGWLLRFGMRKNLIGKEQWTYYYNQIAHIPGQKAGWALDNAIEKGWIGKDEFIHYFNQIAHIPGQKAGWALDNAIEKGWIDHSNFEMFFSKLAQVPYQKLGFPLRNIIEKGWIDVSGFEVYFDQAKDIPGQSLGWTLRHMYKLGLLKDYDNCYNFIEKLLYIEGQELGWFLDILFSDGIFLSESKGLIEIISNIKGQSTSWSLRGLIGKERNIPNSTFTQILRTSFQNSGWYLRKMMKMGEINTELYHSYLKDIENVPGQEPWWSIDVVYEKGGIDEYIFDSYIFPQITLCSKDIDWVILHFYKQGIEFSYLQKYLGTRNEIEFRVILSILKNLAEGKINIQNFHSILETILSSRNQRAGILMAIGIEKGWMNKEDFLGYFSKKSFMDGQSLGWAILSGIRNNWCTQEFTEDIFSFFSRFHGQAVGAILMGMIEVGWVNRENYQNIYDYKIDGRLDRAEHVLMDHVSELGWIRRKDYQDYFTIDDI